MLEKRSKNSSIAILKTYNHHSTIPQTNPKNTGRWFWVSFAQIVKAWPPLFVSLFVSKEYAFLGFAFNF